MGIIKYQEIWTLLKSLTPPLRRSLVRPALVAVSPRSRSSSLALRTEPSLETSRDPSERETTSPSSSAREKPDASAERLEMKCDTPLTLTLHQTTCLRRAPAPRLLGRSRSPATSFCPHRDTSISSSGRLIRVDPPIPNMRPCRLTPFLRPSSLAAANTLQQQDSSLSIK